MLAAGARAAVSQLDRDYDDALVWDFFGRTYGWTKKVVEEELPRKLPELLIDIGSIRAELEREANERES